MKRLHLRCSTNGPGCQDVTWACARQEWHLRGLSAPRTAQDAQIRSRNAQTMNDDGAHLVQHANRAEHSVTYLHTGHYERRRVAEPTRARNVDTGDISHGSLSTRANDASRFRSVLVRREIPTRGASTIDAQWTPNGRPIDASIDAPIDAWKLQRKPSRRRTRD